MKFADIRKLWGGKAKPHYWGDSMDVRNLLCIELSEIHEKRILDLGCSVGIILNCADNSNTKIGVDTSKQALDVASQIAKNRGWEVKYLQEDIFEYESSEKFDVVILANIIEVIPESRREELMSKIISLLKPRGALYLTTPNRHHPYFGQQKLTATELTKYLSNFEYEITAFNPFPLWLGRVVCYIPGWENFLKYLARQKLYKKKSAGLMVKAHPNK